LLDTPGRGEGVLRCDNFKQARRRIRMQMHSTGSLSIAHGQMGPPRRKDSQIQA